MDLDALRHGDFSKLGEAVTDWEQMTKKLADLQKDAETNLKAKADTAKWAGVNATVSREFITKTAAEFADAHTQADSITKILSDTHGELISYRTQLNAAITRGAQQNLTVVDTGEGTFTVTGNTRPDWASDPSGKTGATDQKAVVDLRDEIQGILTKATQSDNSAAKVLRLLVDQAKYGFADASYSDRDEAAKAVAAAEKLAKMAKNPADMSLDDIKDFNRTMETYSGDSLFAEQFATRLGAKGTLQFWTEMTSAHAGARGSELETMKSLQNNLSLTLATASFSDSDAMQHWKKDLVGERNTNFRATNSFSPIGALGSQVISSLMREGQYDTEFLDDYRKTLFKADKVGGENNTDALWVKGYDALDLVFGDGNGRDPLEGLLEGLSHNPEAAVHAFDSKDDLDRLLATTAYTDRGPSLGHALEAAVTGVGLGDSMDAAPPHSETQVQIMANIMEAVAQSDGGSDLVGRGMGESFGHMAASYMPEISRAFGGPNSEAIFLSPSDSPEDFSDRTWRDSCQRPHRIRQEGLESSTEKASTPAASLMRICRTPLCSTEAATRSFMVSAETQESLKGSSAVPSPTRISINPSKPRRRTTTVWKTRETSSIACFRPASGTALPYLHHPDRQGLRTPGVEVLSPVSPAWLLGAYSKARNWMAHWMTRYIETGKISAEPRIRSTSRLSGRCRTL